MSYLFHNIFYRPLLNAISVLAAFLPGNSFAGAIIILTLVVNLILLPFTHRAKHAQLKIRTLQPELDRIKRQFKDKKEEQARRTLELYRQHGVSPFSGVSLLVIQIPLFFALFRILQNIDGTYGTDMYSFLPPLAPLNPALLGFIDLTKPYIPLAFIAALAQFIQGYLVAPAGVPQKKDDFSYILQQQFKYVIPGIILVMGFTFPAALTLYLITMSTFAIVHEGAVRRKVRLLTNASGNGDNAQTT